MITSPHPLVHTISGDGAPVVLLHGLTFDRVTWEPVVERLGGRVRTIAFDLPLHGESGNGPTAFEPLADLLRAELDSLGAVCPLVVGHSMSGGLAGFYASRHPTRGIVLVDSSPWLRPFAEALRQMEAPLRGPGFAELFDRGFQSTMGFGALAPEMRDLVLAHQRIRQDVVLAYWEEILASDPAEFQARVDVMTHALRVPALALMARPLGPEERAHLARIPALTVEEWPGLGHCLHLADPGRFARRLLDLV